MLLNETKPPLDEALVHYGVKGMRWGRRKDVAGSDDDFEFRRSSTKKEIATVALVTVGIVAAALVLKQHGLVPKKTVMRSAAKAAAGAAGRSAGAAGRSAAEKIKESRAPKTSSKSKSKSTEDQVRDGAFMIRSFDQDFWDSPVDFTRDRY